jgi:hypothetical protein
MKNNTNYTTAEMQWPNLINTFTFLLNQDSATADEKIISYLDQVVQKAVAEGFSTEAALKARLRTNLVADKKSKLISTGKATPEQARLIGLLDTYTATKNAGRTMVDRRRRESVVNYNGVPRKSFWQYTVDELKLIDGDASFYQSVVENIDSTNKQENIDRAIRYFGPNYAVIMEQSKRYAASMKKIKSNTTAQNSASDASATKLIDMTLEEKIAKGIPVVITPDVIRELIKLYPNVKAEATEYTEADANAYQAKLDAEAEAKRIAAEEKAAAIAEAKAERERLAAEAKAKREAEAAKADAAKAEEAARIATNRQLILEALAKRKAAKVATTEAEGSSDPSPEDKNFDISGDLWAEAVDEENSKPEIIIPPTSPEMIIWERASKLRDEFVKKATDTICVWDLETEFNIDIDEALTEIATQYPDNFEYDIESGEIRFFPDED